MSAPVSGATPERDQQRVADARYHELMYPECRVEWDNFAGLEEPYCVAGLPAHTSAFDMLLPHYGSDGNAMLSVIDAMKEQPVEVQQRFVWRAHELISESHAAGSTLKPNWALLFITPAAVVAAAIQALGQQP